MTTVGLVGCGNIGGRVAGVLVRAGHRVLACDADATKATATGAEPVSLAEVVQAPVVLLSLPSSREVEAVIEGPGGLLEHGAAGLTIIDLTTADPASTRRLHARCAEQGIAFVDAGVTGGAAAAEQGTLVVLVGGDAEAIETARPVLEAISSQLLVMGPSGAGHATKAVNNVLNAVTLAATGEAMLAGVAAGLDPTRLLEAINAGSGGSWASANRFPRIVAGDEMAGGLSVALMAKDVDVFLRLAEEAGTPTAIAEACIATYRAAIEAGYGDEVANAVVAAMNGGTPLHDR
jgi:3-hydroxyisobutyrate dehydrogenase-like beta-hydroxyacid dehydrogenase